MAILNAEGKWEKVKAHSQPVIRPVESLPFCLLQFSPPEGASHCSGRLHGHQRKRGPEAQRCLSQSDQSEKWREDLSSDLLIQNI